MTTGTGLTSNIGNPLQPSQRELETTAANEWARMRLLIDTDGVTSMVPFSQMLYDAVWKYSSSAGNPTLDMERLNLRTSLAPTGLPSQEWVDIFNRLVNMLPADILEAYLYESSLPLEDRDPVFGSLDNALGIAARTLAWLQVSSQPIDPASPTQVRVDRNLSLPVIAQVSLIDQGTFILNSVETYLGTLDSGSPHFDGLLHFSNDMRTYLNDFQALASQGNQVSKENWVQLATDLQLLNTQLQSISLGDNLQILRPTLDAMVLLTEAASLNPGTAPLLLSASIANIGIDGPAGGMASPILSNVVNNFSQFMIGTMTQNADPGSSRLLPLLAMGAFAGSSYLAEVGRSSQPLDLDLYLHLAVNSGLLGALGEGIARAGGVNDTSVPAAGNFFSCLTFLWLLNSIAKTDKTQAANLAESLGGNLEVWLSSMGKFVSELFDAGEIDDELAQFFSVLLQQTKIACEKKEFDTVIEIVDEAEKELLRRIEAERKEEQREDDNAFKRLLVLFRDLNNFESELYKTGIVQI